MTIPTQSVIHALLATPARESYGLEICKAAGLPSGTIHLQTTTTFDDTGAVATRETRPPPVELPSQVPAAVRLVDIAVLLLPRAHRARYREEFRGELYELGASRPEQLVYGVRLVGRAWALRRALLLLAIAHYMGGS
jgi:hypothetical protein